MRPEARPRLGFFIVFSPLEDTVDLFLEQKLLSVHGNVDFTIFRVFVLLHVYFCLPCLFQFIRYVSIYLFVCCSGSLPIYVAALYLDVKKKEFW